MIDKALKIIKNEVQQFIRLKMKTDSIEEKVVLTSIIDQHGKSTLPKDTVGICLYRIEEDRISETTQPLGRQGKVSHTGPSVKLNLYILFAANFQDYSESLKYISAVIAFFQTKSYFDSSNTPEMVPEMAPLILNLDTQTVDQHNHTWSIFGGNYIPSVIYQLRAILFQEEHIYETKLPTEGVDRDLNKKP